MKRIVIVAVFVTISILLAVVLIALRCGSEIELVENLRIKKALYRNEKVLLRSEVDDYRLRAGSEVDLAAKLEEIELYGDNSYPIRNNNLELEQVSGIELVVFVLSDEVQPLYHWFYDDGKDIAGKIPNTSVGFNREGDGKILVVKIFLADNYYDDSEESLSWMMTRAAWEALMGLKKVSFTNLDSVKQQNERMLEIQVMLENIHENVGIEGYPLVVEKQ